MKALYRNHILEATISEARGPNLLLIDGSLVDQGGAISVFSYLLIPAKELEILEVNDLENELVQQALNYQEPPPSKPEAIRRIFKVYFKKTDLPKTSEIVEYQVFEMNPFTPSKEKAQEVLEAGDGYLITRGFNDPIKAVIIYAVRRKPYKKNLEITGFEVL